MLRNGRQKMLIMVLVLAMLVPGTTVGMAAPPAMGSDAAASNQAEGVQGMLPGAGTLGTCTISSPAADSYIDQKDPNRNFGTASEMKVRTKTGESKRGLVRFDLSACPDLASATITGAQVQLYYDQGDKTSSLNIYQLTESWTEAGATWNGRGAGNWSTPGGSYNATAVHSGLSTKFQDKITYSFDLNSAGLSALSGWVANPGSNNGFLLVGGNDQELKWATKETANDPKLVINYLIGAGGPTIAPDHAEQGSAGETKTYAHVVKQGNTASEVVLLSTAPSLLNASASQGWTRRFYADADQNGVKDNNTPITQTPLLGQNATYGIVMEIDVPVSTPSGTVDETIVKVTGQSSGKTDTATDRTQVGLPFFTEPVIDGLIDDAYFYNPYGNVQDYCDASGRVLASVMTTYDIDDPNYNDVYVVLEMARALVDNSYGANSHPSWAAAGKTQSIGNLRGSDRAQFNLYNANGTLLYSPLVDYVEDGQSTPSTWGSGGITDGEGSENGLNPAYFQGETSIGYNLNRFCTSGIGNCTISGVNLATNSPPIDQFYNPTNPVFNDWEFTYLYEIAIDKAAFGAAGFGKVTIPFTHVSPNKIGSNEIPVTPCTGSIGDRVWQDNNQNGVQDSGEPGLNGVRVQLFRDNGDGSFDPATDIPAGTDVTSGDGAYLFSGLGPGVYWVNVVSSTVPDGFFLTTNNVPLKVTLANGQNFLTADFGYASAADIKVEKWLVTDDPAYVGEEVVFRIRVSNVGDTAIDILPLRDEFDPTALEFVSASPVASNVANGVMTWNDLTTSFGANLAPGQFFLILVRFQALRATSNTMQLASSARTLAAALAPQAEPTVDGLLDAAYNFTQRFPLSSGVPGNLYTYQGATQCYYAFVEDRAFNDNVFSDPDDRAYMVEDGWNRTHKYSDLDGSDKGTFTIQYPGGTRTVVLDLVEYKNGAYLSGFTGSEGTSTTPNPAGSQGATSTGWTFTNSGWTSQAHSPAYNYNSTSGKYWEWHIIYELAVPKSQMGGQCGTVSAMAAHNSPSKYDAALGTIGDLVWNDGNRNGVRDSGEPGLPGVTVKLLQGSTVVRTTQTEPGTSGYYIFNNLAAGTYTVQVVETTLPAGYTTTTNNNPKTVTIASGGQNLTADFGYATGSSSIGDRVFEDINGDGLPDDDGEPGINGVVVKLYQGNCPGSGAPYRTLATSGNGNYMFTNLPAGNYCVSVDGSTVPAGYNLTTANNPLPVSLGRDQSFDDADFGFRVPEKDNTCNVAVVSGARDVFGGRAKDAQDNACVKILSRPSAIGDYVWYDTNRDGLQGSVADEPPIANVTLTLYEDTDGSGGPSVGDTPLALAQTDANGAYLFTGLMSGAYYVQVSDLLGKLTGLVHTSGPQSKPSPTAVINLGFGQKYLDADFGYVAQPADALIGDTVWYDGDGNGAQDSGEPGIPGVLVCATPVGGGTARCQTTNEVGKYMIGVPAGDYLVQPVNPPANLTLTTPPVPLPVTVASGQQYLAADFGYNGPILGAIGNQVWDDTDPNPDLPPDGVFSPPAEPGIPGVTVNLILDEDGDGIWDATEDIIGTAITGASGTYRFDGLPADDYLVDIPDNQPVLANGRYEVSVLGPVQGQNNNNQEQPYAITLAAGEENMTADFGYYRSGGNGTGGGGTIGNQVWEDLDGDGLHESGEPGIPGVTVQLLAGIIGIDTQTTNGSGNYLFEELDPDSYQVQVTDLYNTLAAYLPSRLGPNPGQDENNQAQPYAIALSEDETNLTADFAYVRPASLGDFTWIDTDGDGSYDSGTELPLSGVIIRVTDSQGNVVGTQTTGPGGGFAPGKYLQGNLLPGGYKAQVVFTPTGYTPSGPTSLTTTLLSGEQDLNLDFPFSSTTSVAASSFTAQMRNREMALRWNTVTEQGNTGFHVQRAAAVAGPYEQLTSQPVPSQSVNGAGASYRWVDATAQPGVAYWYQLVSAPDGVVIGPVAAEAGTRIYLPVLMRGR